MDHKRHVITISEMAEIYGIDDGAINKACRDGRIDARQSGKTWLINRDEAERYYRDIFGDGAPDGWITVPAASQKYGITRAAIYDLIKRGSIKSARADHMLYIDPNEAAGRWG